ncbi:Hydrolase tropI [Lachnellula suecica]|uniref:Hydrolase tropI n=1 Tax=Lachnellula suecica TaxID=602035 RepID=A0A8T9C196_9HELO|nr:Hydrolase tropI [Lachnellula suecica]
MRDYTLRSLCAFVAILGLNASDSFASAAYDSTSLRDERPGQVFSSGSVSTDGNSTGEFKNISGISTYLSYAPKTSNSSTPAILYLTDIFGVQLVNNRLLGDNLARAGYDVVMPDLFNGVPVPADALTDPNSTFNTTAFFANHTTDMIDAIVETSINSIRGELGYSKVAAVGYCFGGRFVARFLAAGKGLDAGFAAHPSMTVEAEWQAVASPLSIAFGALDTANTPAQRAAAEAIFVANNGTFQTALYSDAEHGFAVRTNLTDPQKAFAQESAYFQAVRWFDAWVK